jgi:hypothetical protein
MIMKNHDKRNISQVIVAEKKKLITSRTIDEETADPYCRAPKHSLEVKGDMRHFGRCQRITILDYSGNDYTQDEVNFPRGQSAQTVQTQFQHFFADLRHAPMIQTLDLSRFDRRAGCIIRIVPKKPVRFINVTVRICDLFNRELVFDHAWDEDHKQEWIFSYFPKHRLCPDPGNLQITICASEKPREKSEELVDVYELPPQKIREKVLCLN